MDVRGNAGHAVPGEYIIGFKPTVTASERDAALRSFAPQSHEDLGFVNSVLVRIPSSIPAINDIGDLPQNMASLVQWVQPNFLQTLRGVSNLATSSDPEFGRQYHLSNSGQNGGVAGADVRAVNAWPSSTGKGVVIAVADTNVDIEHPDLAPNIWRNPGEIAGNKIDDDGNGYIDDLHGWNFGLNSNRPQDGGQTHGTHVAGIIGAIAGNGISGAGVAPEVTIMPLAVLTSSATTANAIKAFGYAVNNGANIISNSWGNNRFEPALDAAVRATTAAGTMVVVASGNENWDTGVHGSYPDNYPGSVSIAASTSKDLKASYSNRGMLTVDVAAPGDAIFSTLPKGKFGAMSGTSMAAPAYSAVAALVKSRYPHLTMKQVENRVYRSVDRAGSATPWNTLVASGGRINAVNALEPIATPSKIKPQGAGQVGAPIELTWTTDVSAGQRYEVQASQNARAQVRVDESFEGEPTRSFRFAGDKPWTIGTAAAKDGSKALTVDGLRAEQQSSAEITETVTSSTELSFWYRAGKGGELSFFINRDLQFQPAASEEWKQFTTTLQPGEHTLSWLATGRSGTTSAFAVDGLTIGQVSDAKWTPIGEVDTTLAKWTPNAATDGAAIRVRARNTTSFSDWTYSDPFAVRSSR